MTREKLLAEMIALLEELSEDFDFEGDITAETTLLTELGYESLDVVILANTIQENYGQTFPFTDYFAMVGERENNDVTVAEWTDFIFGHLENKVEA